jgi:hypothetical protein
MDGGNNNGGLITMMVGELVGGNERGRGIVVVSLANGMMVNEGEVDEANTVVKGGAVDGWRNKKCKGGCLGRWLVS